MSAGSCAGILVLEWTLDGDGEELSNWHGTAEIEEGATVAESATIWQFAHIRTGARIGERCVIGRDVYIGPGVVVGDSSKLQNHALISHPSVIGAGVFIGPQVVFTNDLLPRAVKPDMTPKSADDWDAVGVSVADGASIGAGTVCIAPVSIGQWAMVAAGSVVSSPVPDFALFAGNPARQFGWVGRSGARLVEGDSGLWVCPLTGERYRLETPSRMVLVA